MIPLLEYHPATRNGWVPFHLDSFHCILVAQLAPPFLLPFHTIQFHSIAFILRSHLTITLVRGRMSF